MRAVVQRVTRASVSVDGSVVSEIGKGIMVLLGITHLDAASDAEWIAKKLLSLRLWPNDAGKEWGANVKQIGGEVLLVSQFTLYSKITKGTKPDFHHAAGGDVAQPIYDSMLSKLAAGLSPDAVKGGVFGAHMEVGLVNDGPVTIVLDSHAPDPNVGKKPDAE